MVLVGNATEAAVNTVPLPIEEYRQRLYEEWVRLYLNSQELHVADSILTTPSEWSFNTRSGPGIWNGSDGPQQVSSMAQDSARSMQDPASRWWGLDV